ncbi:MAG TPA: phosphohydrolase [Rhodospirillaceae bacterium]|nr:MAG: hypothetical protein A2018_02650 [Alphaproteobacteria bacterium GWF2_58_20]HAU29453.1 phosphohydrolase [Rhodospirillaceae bacterium]
MNRDDILLKAQEFVREELAADGSGHDWHHVRRVWENARQLVAEEGGNRFVVEMAALLHDIEDWKVTGKKPGEKGGKVEAFLGRFLLSEADIKAILDVVSGIGYVKTIDTPELRLESLEAKIVSDADKLDAVGAIGIARCFALSGNKNMLIFDPDVFPVSDLTHDRYVDFKRKGNTSINHFFDKLLRLRGMFHTQAAKKEGEKRHQVMVDFLDRFFEENHMPEWQDFLQKFLLKTGG